MASVKGGWSKMLRDFLEMMLLSTDSGFMSTGVPIQIGDTTALLYANMHLLLADGNGHPLALQWNGQAAIKPCFRHWNVFKKDSGRACLREGYVEISSSSTDQFQAWPESEFLAAIDSIVTMQAKADLREVTKVTLERLQRGYGFKATKEGLLSSRPLRGLFHFQKILRYDWVHTFLSQGVLTTELWRLIDVVQRENISSQQDVHEYLSQPWSIPRHRRHQGRTMGRLFDEYAQRANKDAGALKCSASELITLYGMLRCWAETTLPLSDERIKEHVLCFSASAFALTCSFWRSDEWCRWWTLAVGCVRC